MDKLTDIKVDQDITEDKVGKVLDKDNAQWAKGGHFQFFKITLK